MKPPQSIAVVQICQVEWSKQLRGAEGAPERVQACKRPPPPLPEELYSLLETVGDDTPLRSLPPVLVHRLRCNERNGFNLTSKVQSEDFTRPMCTGVKPLELTLAPEGHLQVRLLNDRLALGAPERGFMRRNVGLLPTGAAALVEYNGRFSGSTLFGCGEWSYHHTRMWISWSAGPRPRTFLDQVPAVHFRDMHDLW